MPQREMHRSGRVGWLRAAVLGSDDAIVSTSSLMIGVAAASASKTAILVAGVAGLVAGAMSMAVGEYVSVSSQRDAEQADVGREKRELTTEPEAELQELAQIYVKRGLEKALAVEVAEQLSAHDRLGAHMRDELGIDQASLSRPMQAAWISAAFEKPSFHDLLTISGLTTRYNETPSPSGVVRPNRPKWKSAARFRPPHPRAAGSIHSNAWNCVASARNTSQSISVILCHRLEREWSRDQRNR